MMVWHLSALQTQKDLQAVYRAEHSQRKTEQALKDVCVGLEGIDAANCLNDTIEAADKAHSIEREKDDLTAQEDMAQWAFYMMVASFMSVAVTFAGVVYVRKTLDQTAQTNIAAVNAANAATESNEIMRSDQRPWISFKITDFGEFQCAGSKDGKGSILFHPKVCIKNFGKSPAVDVSFDVKIWEGTKFDEAAEIKQMFSEYPKGKISGRVAFPGEPIIWENWGVGHEIRETGMESDALNAINSFWFVAMVQYCYGKQWFYTTQIFTCGAVEIARGHKKRGFDLHQLPWGDSYI